MARRHGNAVMAMQAHGGTTTGALHLLETDRTPIVATIMALVQTVQEPLTSVIALAVVVVPARLVNPV